MGAARKILDGALALPAEARAALVDALSASLEPVDVSPEWRDEIRRRIEAIERGEAQLVSWADVRARLRAKNDAG
jgi:putative addiction module component (TIGR02574 family)